MHRLSLSRTRKHTNSLYMHLRTHTKSAPRSVVSLIIEWEESPVFCWSALCAVQARANMLVNMHSLTHIHAGDNVYTLIYIALPDAWMHLPLTLACCVALLSVSVPMLFERTAHICIEPMGLGSPRLGPSMNWALGWWTGNATAITVPINCWFCVFCRLIISK